PRQRSRRAEAGGRDPRDRRPRPRPHRPVRPPALRAHVLPAALHRWPAARGRAAMKVLRDGQRLTLAVTLKRMLAQDDRIPPYVFERGPDYAVVGGLVFQDLTGPYLSTWGDWSRRAPPRLLVAYDREGQEPSPEHPRIILLTSVLPDPANLGYQDQRD